MLIANPQKGQPAPSRFREFKGKPYVVAELRYDSAVSLSERGFQAPAAKEKQAATLNSVLEGFRIERVGSHFGLRASALRERSVHAPTRMPKRVSGEFAQSGVVQMVPRSERECAALVRRLNRLDSVWKAYEAPRPVPASASAGSPNMEPAQGYLYSAPDGVNAPVAWQYYGGMGEGVAVCDIEGDWNFDHEDLPNITHFGGDLLGAGWRDHGTAVLGEIVGRQNSRGVSGIAPRARPKVHSAVIDGLWNTAQAIVNSSNRLDAGDVILIELQGTHPISNSYVAMQYWDDVYSAIRTATDERVTVVEAAGNGGQNFQSSVYAGSNLRKDAGAIVVGAGVPPTNYYDYTQATERYTTMGVPRSRTWFSNYGNIVNVQGWGEHVTTLGYGDAQGGAQNRWYTHRFSGTSSASPIVTGVVACLQGIAMHGGYEPLTPAQVRRILMDTGTPQASDPAQGRSSSQRIGPLPDLERAIRRI